MKLEECVKGTHVRLKGYKRYPENQYGKIHSVDEKGIVKVQLISESTWVNYYLKHHNDLVKVDPHNPEGI